MKLQVLCLLLTGAWAGEITIPADAYFLTCPLVVGIADGYKCPEQDYKKPNIFAWTSMQVIKESDPESKLYIWGRSVVDESTYRKINKGVQRLQTLDHPRFLKVQSHHRVPKFWSFLITPEEVTLNFNGVLVASKDPRAAKLNAIRQVAEAVEYLHSKNLIWAQIDHNKFGFLPITGETAVLKVYNAEELRSVDEEILGLGMNTLLEPTLFSAKSPETKYQKHFDSFALGVLANHLYQELAGIPFLNNGQDQYKDVIRIGNYDVLPDVLADLALVTHLMMLRDPRRRLIIIKAIEMLKEIERLQADLSVLGKKFTLNIDSPPTDALLALVHPDIKKIYDQLQIFSADTDMKSLEEAEREKNLPFVETKRGKLIIFSITVAVLVLIFAVVLVVGLRWRGHSSELKQPIRSALDPEVTLSDANDLKVDSARENVTG